MIDVLATSGLAAGVNKIVSPILHDKAASSIVFNTFFSTRKQAAWFSMSILIPIGAFLLFKQQVSPLKICTLSICLIISSLCRLDLDLIIHPLKIFGLFTQINRISTKANLIGTPLTILLIFIWPTAESLLLAASFISILQNYDCKKILKPLVDYSAKIDRPIQKLLIKSYLTLLPNSIYYGIQGQISAFVLGTFGKVQHVAELGALSRLGRAYSAIGTYQQSVLTPRFTRAKTAQEWRKSFLIAMLFSVCIALATIAAMGIFPHPFLFLLGKTYYGMEKELFWVSVGMGQELLIGQVVQANFARGWIYWSSRLQIFASITGMVVGACIFDLSSVSGVIQMGVLSRLPALIVQIFDLIGGYQELRRHE